MQELEKWPVRTVEMLTEADPRSEEPVFKWRRNAKVSVETERQVQPFFTLVTDVNHKKP